MRRLSALLIFIIFCTLPTLVVPGPGFAQESETEEAWQETGQETESIIPEDFTGTFADDDPESDVFEETQLFGEDEAAPGEKAEEVPEEDLPTHLLRFEFESLIVITDSRTENPYMEIRYFTKIEQEIQVKNKRYRTKGTAEIMTDIIGNLAGNELFACKLDIQMANSEVDIMTRYNIIPETEEEPEKSELALQIKFNRENLLEDWFSNCTAVDGSIFNTVGEKEKYLFMTIESVTPALSSIVIENYDTDLRSTLDVFADSIQIDDDFDDILLEGTGTIDVDPL